MNRKRSRTHVLGAKRWLLSLSVAWLSVACSGESLPTHLHCRIASYELRTAMKWDGDDPSWAVIRMEIESPEATAWRRVEQSHPDAVLRVMPQDVHFDISDLRNERDVQRGVFSLSLELDGQKGPTKGEFLEWTSGGSMFAIRMAILDGDTVQAISDWTDATELLREAGGKLR